MKKTIFVMIAMLFAVSTMLFSVTSTIVTAEDYNLGPGDTLSITKGSDKVNKSMEVRNPALQLSESCKVLGDIGYVTIKSISSWTTQELYNDIKVLKSMGIKKVWIYMNSGGGSAMDGLAISDVIRIAKNDGMEITVDAYGIVASAAIPIFLSASKRIASEKTIFMMHPAALFKAGYFSETLKDLDSQREVLVILRDFYASIVVDNSNLKKEEVLAMMDKDTWFLTPQAKEWGMVDEIK
jgi:ATP-dependent protease ClpP protease subunit